AGVKYVGCFKDNRYRDLPVVYTANYKTTKAYCFRYCRAKGYRYFGLQNGNACTCGNTVGRYGKAKSKDCARSTCKGDKRSKCGGPWRNSVFTTGLKPKSFKTPGMSHIGCFVDGRRRDLPTLGGKGSMTVGRCYGLCKKKGFRFFGVQIGKQCWCGNHYGRYGRRDKRECRYQCRGDKTTYCGGSWRNDVYATGVVVASKGKQCWCGNHYGRYGRRDKRECRYQCRGDKTTYCGGSWRNDVYATGLEEHASGVTLLGCFRDNSKRDLPLVHGAGHRTTKAYCLKYCKSRGYRYFGLQAGSACTCGNKYGSFGRVNAKQCRTRCRGDKRRTCGGSWRNSVYSTGIGSKPVRLPGLKHLGCYLDKSSRDLRKLVLSGSVTVPKCYKACKARKYRFFGVQNGYQCWCGNHYGRYRIRSNLECRVQCRGDKSTYCGGAWRNNVYATGVVVASKAAGVKYVGCFKDNRYRDLPVVYTANYKTTKAYCFRYCRAKGYRYFGLQNGNACTCGNTVGRYGKAKSKDCARSTCKGDKRSKCGGPWRNSVFTTGLKPKSFKTPGMSHIGCFVDGRRRDLPTLGGKGSMTVGRCYGLCKKKGFRFFGVQIGKQCWCGNHYGRYGRRDKRECRYQCRGDKTTYCGGSWRNDVYATGVVVASKGKQCWCGNHYGRYGRRDKRECRYQCRGDKTTYCGGSWRNDVYATGLEEHASGVTLLGCFRDNSKRDLPLVHGAGHRTTKAYCLKYCKSRGYRYFGLQAGSACTCGNKYGSFGRVNAKQCRTRCRGDKRRTCGGSWRNSVYSTGIGSKPVRLPGLKHLGCYLDKSSRDLRKLVLSGSVTVPKCYKACKARKYRFFGVQNGYQCWCGNHYGRYRIRSNLECRVQCRGDKSTYCGGAWRNNVYATGVVVASKAAGVKYVGCFKDNRYRDLPVVYTANYKTTKAYCFRYCRAKGYRYFGLQNGNACTCGNTVGRYGKAKSKDCARSTCKGDKRSKCGGPWRNSVFTTGLKPKSFKRKQCWCGNHYGRYGRRDKRECRYQCRGDKTTYCGGSWRNDVYATGVVVASKAPGMSHIGCFVDGRRRDLPTVGGKGSITVGRCYGLCKKKGFRFFGVQIGKQCWCGNHYGRYGRRDKRECRYQCRGDKTTYCGGSWRNDVYATGLEEHASGVTLLGCFRDNSKRDLPLVHGAGHRTTKAYCLKYCKSRGYRYFGLQAGSACTCGNKYGSFGRVNAKQCRTRCRGDKRRTCGGSWRNSVYSTGIGSKPVRLPGLKHLGCYLDKSSRDLRKLVLSGSVTVPKCYKACKARKYRFFGVQNGYQCWCGNHYGRYRIRSNLECRVQCRGDKSTYCGGAGRSEVRRLLQGQSLQGFAGSLHCQLQDDKGLLLPLLSSKGYRYFGLQNGNACTCGNTVGRYGKAKSKDCARST
uniref:WSC domain-containing protein n=1 Tax=Macrostomum lignano TaxID=282301 RepID=A0A1I8JDN6_9PLAT